VLLNNLNDEEGGDPTHPQLWLGFARGLGLTDGEVEATPAQPETLDAVEAFRARLPQRAICRGCCALYAYESQIPEMAATKIDGLKRHYDITMRRR